MRSRARPPRPCRWRWSRTPGRSERRRGQWPAVRRSERGRSPLDVEADGREPCDQLIDLFQCRLETPIFNVSRRSVVLPAQAIPTPPAVDAPRGALLLRASRRCRARVDCQGSSRSVSSRYRSLPAVLTLLRMAGWSTPAAPVDAVRPLRCTPSSDARRYHCLGAECAAEDAPCIVRW